MQRVEGVRDEGLPSPGAGPQRRRLPGVGRAQPRLGHAARGTRLLWLAAKKAPFLLTHRKFPRRAERLLARFRAGGPLSSSAYEDLFRYFATGWRVYRTPDGAGAAYPGLPSWNGARVDQLEGFSRIMPLFGAWCASGRETEVRLPRGAAISLPLEFERGLLAGTDPHSPAYWGDMPGKSNQRIVEAADVALALWLFRDTVWANLSDPKRAAVLRWLSLVEDRTGLDNNWHLFFILVDRVLAALGYPDRIPTARERYERVKAFHLGDGWFKDGPNGKVDFYNAWGFHYALYWIDKIDPEWDRDFIQDCQRRFLGSYKYLIGPNGIPMLGRSVCYRLAAPAPMIQGHDLHPDVVCTGEARRALDSVWRHFVRRGAVRHGTVSQGYYAADARILDPYSGPASSLWSLRSLVAAFTYPRESAFWKSAGRPLPVERRDYDITLHGPRWRIVGERENNRISIELLDNPPDAAPSLEPVGRIQLLRRFAEGWPPGPRNNAGKYGRRFYRSDEPFCC